jgi:hypothetical protein
VFVIIIIIIIINNHITTLLYKVIRETSEPEWTTVKTNLGHF